MNIHSDSYLTSVELLTPKGYIVCANIDLGYLTLREVIASLDDNLSVINVRQKREDYTLPLAELWYRNKELDRTREIPDFSRYLDNKAQVKVKAFKSVVGSVYYAYEVALC